MTVMEPTLTSDDSPEHQSGPSLTVAPVCCLTPISFKKNKSLAPAGLGSAAWTAPTITHTHKCADGAQSGSHYGSSISCYSLLRHLERSGPSLATLSGATGGAEGGETGENPGKQIKWQTAQSARSVSKRRGSSI